jgi:TonB family protein
MKNRIALFLLLPLSFLTLTVSHAVAQESSQSIRKVVDKVMPTYPSLARTMNIVGAVRADVTVAPNGKVRLVELRGGHPVLGKAAEDALQHWKWEPAAHETHESVELRFNP